MTTLSINHSVNDYPRFSGLSVNLGPKKNSITLLDSKDFKNNLEHLKKITPKEDKSFIKWKSKITGFKPAEVKQVDKFWLPLGDSFLIKVLSEKLRVVKHLDNPKKFPQQKELRDLLCKAVKGLFDRETSKKVKNVIRNGKIESGVDQVTSTKFINFEL